MTTERKPITGPVSPIDGRYANKTAELGEIFSEQTLMHYRIVTEIEYLIFLSKKGIVRPLSSNEIKNLVMIPDIDEADFAEIQAFEKKTNHDVKAVEYFIHSKMKGTSLEDLIGFVHIGLTSEDINNVAYAFMLRDGVLVLNDYYLKVSQSIMALAEENKNCPMLALTHGQPASPTTFGWEMKSFSNRLLTCRNKLKQFKLLVKFGGATGGHNALYVAYPDVNWRKFSTDFVNYLSQLASSDNISFEHNIYVTQIEPHDTYSEMFSIISEANIVLKDFSRDIWMYISRGVIKQKAVDGEVGSSAMPQKVNPINFENAEGNLGLANAMLDFFRNKLPVSRFQRDLSDSTVERNFGSAFAYTLISLKAILAGMKRVSVNVEKIQAELEDCWEVVAEAYQVILRANGAAEGYELLKDFTRGKKMTRELMHSFIDKLYSDGMIHESLALSMKEITPMNYIGDRNF